jgi:hypothetical protein
LTIAFQSSGSHIQGFRFFNEATAAVNYGYLVMSTTGPSGFPATITSWAYENSGVAIDQPIPEPSTGLMLPVGALALGACSLRHRRARRTPRA